MEFKEVRAKSILTKSGIPGVDYVINPYIGCRFACIYCYASFMGRFVDKNVTDWGEYVYAKVNAPDLLKKEIRKLKNNGKGLEIFLSSVTDPYQGMEAKYKLTRQCLEIIRDSGYTGVVSILTKSDLVTRDIDIFRTMPTVVVGLTVTSANDSISRYFEKYAPPVSKRLEALKLLNDAGIKTCAFMGPLLPHFVVQTDELETVFKSLHETGTRDIFIEHLNLARYIRERLLVELKDADRGILEKFYSSQTKEYRHDLEKIIRSLIAKYSMRLLTDTVIFHREFQKQPSAGNNLQELIS